MSIVKKEDTQATPTAIRAGEFRNSVVFTTEEVIHRHDIYLTHEMLDARKNLEILNVLRTCDEHDTINFYLNNYGGDCAAGTQLINTLVQCKAKQITVYVDSSIYSMASIFAIAAVKLAGAAIVLGDAIMFMFHNYSGSVFGKGHEQVSAIEAEKQLFAKSDIDRLFPFLSTKEIQDIQDGKDRYVLKDEAATRLDNLINFMAGKDYYDGDKLISAKKVKKVKDANA